MSAVAFGDGREPGRWLRWAAAALVVAGLHAGAGWWVVGRPFLAPTPPDGVAGVTIDLEPVSAPIPPTAEPKPMERAGPGPDRQVAETPDAPEIRPEPPMEPPTAEPPPTEALAPPPPEPAMPVPQVQPEPPPPTPALVPAPAPEIVPPPAPAPSDAVVAPPPRPSPTPAPKKVAAPKPPKPAPPKPDPREVARQEARLAQAEAREEARRDARAKAAADARAERQTARAEARAARAAAAREGGGADRESAAPAASGAAVSSWRGEVVAHLNAYKPASPDGSGGTVHVAFSVDRGGRVTSAAVSGSSGDPALDAAAVSMVRRASPVPAPPPELGGRISLAVPVRFH